MSLECASLGADGAILVDASGALHGEAPVDTPLSAVGAGDSLLAGFLATSTGLRLPIRAETIDELAAILGAHWELEGAGAVVSQPLPSDLAIPISELGADEAAPVRGPDRTPAELSRLQARLGDRVIQANVALLERNAALAGALAAALVRREVAVPARG